jgi:inner membrane protein
MKWHNHIIIGSALAATINPILVPVGIIGATAPDWIEYALKPFYPVRHRTVTHVVLYWIFGIVLFYCIDYRHIGLAFAIGGFSHVMCDAFTISGVPFAPWSRNRFHLFGGKLRTGNAGEYIVSGIIAVLCFGFVMYSPVKMGIAADKENGFIPFFFDHKNAYETGLEDAKEWRDNRMKFF